MTQDLAIALAQTNPKVGDIAGNLVKIRAARNQARHDRETIMMNMMLGAVAGLVKTMHYIHHD